MGRPEPTIKFSSEAVTDKVKNGLGCSEENEEAMRSPSLNCNIASLTREHPDQNTNLKLSSTTKHFGLTIKLAITV